jgi:branched-chain amino acid transport system substrate-binding protein
MLDAWTDLLLTVFLGRFPGFQNPTPRPVFRQKTMVTANGYTLRHVSPLTLAYGTLALIAAGGLSGCNPEPPATPLPTPAPTTEPGEIRNQSDEPLECRTDPYGCAVIAPDQTIKIGMAGPLTGQYSAYGTDIMQAAQLAIDDFGEYLGWQFELVAEDTQGDPGNAQYVATNWTHDPTLVAVAGHVFAGETEVTIPIYESADIPMLSPSATTPDLTRQGSRVFNRIVFTDAIQAQDAADYLYSSLGIRRLALIHDGEAYGQALAELTAEDFATLGGNIVDTRSILPGEEDYLPTLTAIATSRPEAIYFGGYDSEAAVLISQMEEAGLEDVIFFGCDSTFSDLLLTRVDSETTSVYSASLIPPFTAQRNAFDQAYEDRWGDPPGTLSPYTWNGYDAVGALIFVTKQAALVGNDGNLYIPRDTLVSAVRNLSGYAGISGDITCDAIGECSTSGPTFYTIERGRWVPSH